MAPIDVILDTAFFVFLATCLAIGIISWLRIFKNDSRSYLKVVHPKPFGLLDVGICFFAWLIVPATLIQIMLQVSGAGSFEVFSDSNRNGLLILVSVFQLTFTFLALWVVSRRYGGLADVFGIQLAKVSSHLALAVKAFAMVVPVLLLLQKILSLIVPYQHSTLENLHENFSLTTILVSWLGAVVAAPICEEVFFRGFLQGWLQRVRFAPGNDPMEEIVGGWPAESCDTIAQVPGDRKQLISWWLPIVISSTLFGAIHINQGLAPFVLFFFSLALGFLYRYTGSIVPSIILHFFLNAFSMFWATLSMLQTAVEDSI